MLERKNSGINLNIDEVYVLNSQENNQNRKELTELKEILNNICNSIKDLNKKVLIHCDKEAIEKYMNLKCILGAISNVNIVLGKKY
ncbi:hypothetical protein DVW02_05095 [Clostridium botulinum]|nr:hypothetical protein [Clostridium botulinum]